VSVTAAVWAQASTDSRWMASASITPERRPFVPRQGRLTVSSGNQLDLLSDRFDVNHELDISPIVSRPTYGPARVRFAERFSPAAQQPGKAPSIR